MKPSKIVKTPATSLKPLTLSVETLRAVAGGANADEVRTKR